MAVDWDALVLKPAMGIFGADVTYRRPGDPSFTVSAAVFDRAYEAVSFGEGGVPISSRQPMLGVRQAVLPLGFEPLQGDEVSVEGATYTVMDVQADGKGGIKLLLTSRESEGP